MPSIVHGRAAVTHQRDTPHAVYLLKSRRPREAVHILDLEIREAIHKLDLEIGEAVHDFPFAGGICKTVHDLDFQVREAVDHFYFEIGEAVDIFNLPVDF